MKFHSIPRWFLGILCLVAIFAVASAWGHPIHLASMDFASHGHLLMAIPAIGLPDMLSVGSMTQSINTVPEMPTKVGDSGLFEEEGIVTPNAVFDVVNGRLSLVPAVPRGSDPTPVKRDPRSVHVIRSAHLPATAVITPDEFDGIRAFGDVTVEQGQAKLVANRIQNMKNRLTVTREFHRVGALRGQVLDADGSVLTDLYTEFGVTKRTQDMVLGTAGTEVREKVLAIKRAAEAKLGGVLVQGWRAYCSPTFFDALTKHATVKEAFKAWEAAQERLGGDMRKGFNFGGVEWIEYGASVGGTAFIPEKKAAVFPVAAGLYKLYNAPADYNETANTMGVPYYSKAEPRRFGKGFDLEAQSNPVALCLDPSVLTEAFFA